MVSTISAFKISALTLQEVSRHQSET